MASNFIKGSVALSALLIASSASAEEVRVYNWSDYIEDSILTDFEKETGIKVVYDVFDSNELLETKLLAGASGYDVVVPTASFLARQIQAGVFQKLDPAMLPNKANVWKEVAERVERYDPENAYSINYMWGTTGVGMVQEKIDERLASAPTTSWDMIFNPEIASKFQDCGIHWLDAPAEIFPAALNYLGLDPNSTKKEDLEAAADMMMKVRGTVRKFHSSEYISALANGDICLAIGWSGDVLQAQARAGEANNGLSINYSIPGEGAQMWFDQMAIPADAPNPDAAHKFINYILNAEVAAKATNYIAYANGNKASQAFIDKAVLEDTAVYPDEATVQNLYTVNPYNAKATRLINRLWTRIKTGQ